MKAVSSDLFVSIGRVPLHRAQKVSHTFLGVIVPSSHMRKIRVITPTVGRRREVLREKEAA